MRFDQFSNQVSNDYALFTLALSGLCLRTAVTPQSIAQLQVEGHRAVNSFVKTASDAADYYLITLDDGVVSRDQRDRQGRLLTALRIIATKNLTDSVLRVKNGSAPKSMLYGGSAAMDALMKQAQDKQDFKAVDSAGRVWHASKLVKALTRDFAYQTLIDMQAATLAAIGDLAVVSYPDATHVYNGLVISFTGTPEYPSLASVRSAIFHPNASAQLVGMPSHV